MTVVLGKTVRVVLVTLDSASIGYEFRPLIVQQYLYKNNNKWQAMMFDLT